MKQAPKTSLAERVLDRAIELTFPASDPISVEHAFRSAREHEAPLGAVAMERRTHEQHVGDRRVDGHQDGDDDLVDHRP